MAPRKFQLTKVRSGDWLLPSNDGNVLWRITKRPNGWALYSRPMPQSDAQLRAIEWDEWDEWDMYDHDHFATRDAAVTEALRDPTSSGLVFDIRAGGFVRP